jgi:hypothetical protein
VVRYNGKKKICCEAPGNRYEGANSKILELQATQAVRHAPLSNQQRQRETENGRAIDGEEWVQDACLSGES